jgi:hypothetical protein
MRGVVRTALADLTLARTAKSDLHVCLLLLGFVLAYELAAPCP